MPDSQTLERVAGILTQINLTTLDKALFFLQSPSPYHAKARDMGALNRTVLKSFVHIRIILQI